MELFKDEHIIKSLNKVNWNFPGSSTLQNTIHTLNSFPGNFIPQIPSYLIQILSKKGDIVCDPFCGCGTTGVETLLQGRQSLQNDINRSAVLISEGKLIALTNLKIQHNLNKVLNEILLSYFKLPAYKGLNKNIDHHSDLTKWFHKDTYTQLLFLWDKIKTFHNKKTRIVLEMIFSDTLYSCASTTGSKTSTGKKRRHHWGWIADNVKPRYPVSHDAIKLFRDRLMRAIDVIGSIKDKPKNCFKLFRGDTRNLELQNSSVDVVITSPPYIGMIDYTLANRLYYQWVGWPIKEDKDKEIGARFKRNRLKIENEYLSDMISVSKEIKRILRNKGYCAIVIGASRKYPHIAKEVINLFSNELNKIWGPIERFVSKRRISERKGSEITELICVYQNLK